MFAADSITGQLRIVAPGRARRLGPRPVGCPFCAGNEEHTPPEIARLTGDDGAWRARAVPNLFPLAQVHEVLIPTPRHVTSLRELAPPEWTMAVALWLERLAAHAALGADGSYLHLFVNDGAGAGASLEHSHAQLVAVPRAPQVLELTTHVRSGSAEGCALCALGWSDDELLVFAQDGLTLRAMATPRTGGALLLAPVEHGAGLALFAAALPAALERAVQALQPGPFNLWLVQDPDRGVHPYIELVPRSAIPAGMELALGVGVSTQDPVEAALQARARLA